ncbi:50S ribosomal protein L29 [Planctomycetota bacterium]
MKSSDFIANMRELTEDELREKQSKIEEELFLLHYRSVTEQNDNVSAVKEKKKDLARVITIINGRTKGIEKQTGV